jgi:transposase InsO family protein
MQRMGIEALYRRSSPGPSTPAREAAIYPYFIDVARRKVLAWRLSNTLTADVYVAALEEALKKFGPRRFLIRDSPVTSGSRH